MDYKQKAFTLVELLVVVGIISILTVAAMTGAITLGDRARNNRSHEDIETIARGIEIARANSGLTLMEIITLTDPGQTCTECACRTDRGATPESLLDKTSTCWVKYMLAIDAINLAAGYEVIEDYPEDAWGSPYLINQNEGEGAGGGCSDSNADGFACCTDNLAAVGPNRATESWYDTDDIVVNISSLCFPSEGSHHPDQN